VKRQHPGVPCFLYGHSTGAAIALKVNSLSSCISSQVSDESAQGSCRTCKGEHCDLCPNPGSEWVASLIPQFGKESASLSGAHLPAGAGISRNDQVQHRAKAHHCVFPASVCRLCNLESCSEPYLSTLISSCSCGTTERWLGSCKDARLVKGPAIRV
jgi:hypothetical protein